MRNKQLLTPPRVITLSFAAMILTGALLLNLPFASRDGQSIGFVNSLFTATSANCVTGLVVVNTMEHWTLFGKLVILVLIQLGALGFITVFTLGMMLMRREVPLRNRLVIQASFNQESVGGMVRLVRNVVLATLSIEAIGAVLLAVTFAASGGMSLAEAMGNGVFHSISAFCNAGFDIIGTESLTPYRGNLPVNLIIMALIVSGGLGFTVWAELASVVRNKKRRSLRLRIKHLSLHSKIVFAVTDTLIALGTVLYLLFEWTNRETLGPLPFGEKLLAAMFQSISMRTAGFNTISQAGLTEISQFISCILMIIGGSSASTAGGMKTVTVGVIVFSMLSVLKGRRQVEAFGRTLPLDLLQKALTVVCTVLLVVLGSTAILHFTEQSNAFAPSFMDLLFESCSAAGTVGVSTGLTPFLSTPGKLVLTVCMFLGRLSPVTVVVALSMKLHTTASGTEYPDERVIIG